MMKIHHECSDEHDGTLLHPNSSLPYRKAIFRLYHIYLFWLHSGALFYKSDIVDCSPFIDGLDSFKARSQHSALKSIVRHKLVRKYFISIF